MTIERTIIKSLFGLSGNLCAFPNCAKRIVEADGTVIGQICHIEAAEPRGERFNSGQTDKERASFPNLLLLCKGHHELTNDVKIYTIEVLREMKRKHEEKHSSAQFVLDDNKVDKIMEQINFTQNNNNTGGGMLVAPQRGDVHIHGLSLSDGITLFKELFDANMPKLKEEATRVAEERTKSLWDKFAARAADEKITEEKFAKFAEPEIQATLTTAIKISALRDNVSIRDSLAALLIKKLNQSSEDIKSIVLSEAISTIAKLTTNQLRGLALIFIVRHTNFNGIKTWGDMNKALSDFAEKFMDCNYTETDLQHLEYAGCISINRVSVLSTEQIWSTNYPWLFNKPINLSDSTSISEPAREAIKQFGVFQEGGYRFILPAQKNLEIFLIEKGLASAAVAEIVQLHSSSLLDTKKTVLEKSPIGTQIEKLWASQSLHHLTLTSVGIMLAITTHEQVSGMKFDLQHWFK